MNSLIIKRINSIFPSEWEGIHQLDLICRDFKNEEAYEKTFSFLHKEWKDLTINNWQTHGSVGFLNVSALVYYLPSLLYWAHVDYKSVSLAFDCLTYMLSNGSDGDFPFEKLSEAQRNFIADFLCLFPDSLSALYGNEDYLESSLMSVNGSGFK